ncbi:MAG: DUF4097 family beta strand repeat-containing protein [Vicinamibacterales bacterium]
MRQTLIALTVGLAWAAPAVARPQESPRLVERTRPQVRVQVQPGRDAREEHSETFKKVVRIGSHGELDVSNVTGDITITRGSGNDALIEVTKVARARTSEEARALLPLVRVDIAERGNRVELRTVYPSQEHILHNRRNINVTVHYAISAPAATRVIARSLTGNLRASEITGELSLITTSGNVQVSGGRNVGAVKSTSGSIEVSDTDSESGIEASSISGNVTMRQVKAPRVELGSVSGKIIMHDVQCARVEADSLSGDVEFVGLLTKGGRYEMNSHSGNVRLAVATGVGFEIEANSWSGKVETDLQITGNHEPENRRNGRRSKTLRGVLGDGSAVLDITTFSGNVWIGKK